MSKKDIKKEMSPSISIDGFYLRMRLNFDKPVIACRIQPCSK